MTIFEELREGKSNDIRMKRKIRAMPSVHTVTEGIALLIM